MVKNNYVLVVQLISVIEYYNLSLDLDKACQSRKESMLEDAVEQTKKSGLNQPLNSKIVVATRILSRIYQIDKISKIVSKIDQRSLAELKMYQTPPNVVHQTLVAASLLLGYGLEEVKVTYVALFSCQQNNENCHNLERIGDFYHVHISMAKKKILSFRLLYTDR